MGGQPRASPAPEERAPETGGGETSTSGAAAGGVRAEAAGAARGQLRSVTGLQAGPLPPAPGPGGWGVGAVAAAVGAVWVAGRLVDGLRAPGGREVRLGREGRERMADLHRRLQGWRVVEVPGINLGTEGAMYLSSCLAFNSTLESLDLSQNGIGPAGTVALAENLKKNGGTLGSLALGSNQARDEGCAALAEALRAGAGGEVGIYELDLSSNGIGDAGAQALADALEESPILQRLDLSNNEIDLEGVMALARGLQGHRSMRHLNLSGNYVGGLGAKALAQALQENDCLEELLLGGNGIGDEGCRELLAALAEAPHRLSWVDLPSNAIGPAGAKALADFLLASASPQFSGGAGSPPPSGLRKLDLYMNELGDAGVAQVAEAVREVRGLEELNLGGNGFGAAGAAALAAALQNNPDLQTLELGYNNLGKEGAKEVAAAVKFHPSLSTLRMGWCQIGEEGAAEFAEALRFNEHLTCLDLRGNGLGDKGLGAFASIIQAVGFEKLEELDLSYNEIRDRGAFTLANAMKANPKELSLERMSLGNNYLTEFGKAAIDEAASLVGEFNPKGGLEIPY